MTFPILPASNPASTGYTISRSVRLRSSASAYFNRTPASAGNRKLFTISTWVKRGKLGANQDIMTATSGAGGTVSWLRFNSSDQLDFVDYNGASFLANAQTTAVFRDPGAWYYVTVAFDSAQATAANRLKIYVNNVQYTLSGTLPSLNGDSYFNINGAHYIGREARSAIEFLDGYLAEFNFIDGQALTPSSFGTANATTGVWQPARYTGTYGTNGFYLNFSDNSAATAAAIGKDYSGNSNNWTPNNISVTAGSTYDSMIDTPTPYADGSTGRGNYCTLNPLQPASTTVVVPTDGNLKMTGTASGNNVTGTMAIPMAAYFEGTVVTGGGTVEFGVKNLDTGNTYVYDSNGNKYLAGTGSAYGATFTTNDIIGVAIDPVNLTLQFYKNGTSQGTISSAFPSGNYVPFFYASNTNAAAANFGQRPFTYTPPSGFKALNTYNLPASTITNGGKYMAATTYTATGAAMSITNAGSFKPDLVWIKGRSQPYAHEWYDSVRGVQLELQSNTTLAETTQTTGVTAFNTNGFTGGTRISPVSGDTMVAWQWQAGQGSTSSNTSGSITSTVSVNATAGFSVVTYTGTGANATVGHGLGVAPAMMICKIRNSVSTENWYVWHQSISGSTPYIYLNLTNAAVTGDSTRWTAAPTSTLINLGSNSACNGNTGTYVTYCWAQIAGFSKFGSYTGNGSTDGPFVYCGFRPRFVMVKRIDLTNDWFVVDTSRDTYNIASSLLRPNTSAVEQSVGVIDVLSNGFKPRTTDSAYNASGGTYIYAAFAENPFANALAR